MTVHSYLIPAGTAFRNHEHDSVHVCAVLGGGLSERVRKGTEELASGSVRLSPPTRHDIDFGPAATRCVVFKVPHALSRPLPRSLFIHAEPRLARLAAGAHNATRHGGPDRALLLDGITAEFIAQIDRLRDGRALETPRWVTRVRELIHDTPVAMSVTDLARAVHVHRVHLARVFRDHYGIPVTRYVQRVRVHRAIELLIHTSEPLTIVAARAGYADQSHLSRSLRATLGATPMQIRRGDVTSVQDRDARLAVV